MQVKHVVLHDKQANELDEQKPGGQDARHEKLAEQKQILEVILEFEQQLKHAVEFDVQVLQGIMHPREYFIVVVSWSIKNPNKSQDDINVKSLG